MRPCRGGRGGGCRSALASEEAPTAEALGAEAAIHQSPTEGDEAFDEGASGVAPVAAAYSGLAAPIVRADVMLSSDADALEVLVGSFASDGLTFAIQPDGTACLVAAAPDALAGGAPALAIPDSVEHAGATYEVAAIGAHAFSLCGAEAVVLPASVASVDEDALWPASVQRVEVDAANPSYASYDGILYDAALTRLLSIPGGRQGAVRISDKAEEVETSVFSHCAGVDAVSVDAGGANLASWDGLLYDADGTTLLRVPAGATDVTIREGCTTVAAGALEGCTSLETITAPASVTSVSSGVFSPVPITSTLASPEGEDAPQVLATVAIGNAMPRVDAAAIEVSLAADADEEAWVTAGFSVSPSPEGRQAASSFAAATTTVAFHPNGHRVKMDACYDTGDGRWVTTSTEYITESRTFNVLDWSYYGTKNLLVVTARNTGGHVWDGFNLTGAEPGYTLTMITDGSTELSQTTANTWDTGALAVWRPNEYSVSFDMNGASGAAPAPLKAKYDADVELPAPAADPGLMFAGWSDSASGGGATYPAASARNLTTVDGATVTLYAQWAPRDYDIGFDVDSEPGDEERPGEPKDDQTANVETGAIEIEDPKRPGYVFQGWVIPNEGGTEAIDQDLVYQGDDGKWYVDASKLPDYADGDGHVELTARWTSVISVDVPSRVTFLADVVTQGQGSRDGLVQGAFAQAKAVNRSEVDLRIVGLEATAAVSGDGALGADAVLRQASDATPASSAQKLLSVYPSDELPTSDELKDPTRVSALPDGAVGFDLGDTLLEAAFDPEAFAIPAGGQLSLGYRLNLAETATELDYDALSSLDPGESAQIATVSYTFAIKSPIIPTGDITDALWVRNENASVAAKGVYGLADIRKAAADLAALGEESIYWSMYESFIEEGTVFHAKLANGSYLDMWVIGLCQDNLVAGGKAGITFQSVNAGWLASMSSASAAGVYGWAQPQPLRTTINTYFDATLKAAMATVVKYQQTSGGTISSYLQRSEEVVFLPNYYEVYGAFNTAYVSSERYLPAEHRFQYLGFAGEHGDRREKLYGTEPTSWWLRTARSEAGQFVIITGNGGMTPIVPTTVAGVAPCFCL